MTEIEDLSDTTYNDHEDEHFTHLSVGWLGNNVTSKGETAAELLSALHALKEKNQLLDGWMGVHTCEICEKHHDKGEFYAEGETTRYIMPNMIIHYIENHLYKLPSIVEAAVIGNQGKA